MRQVTKLRLLQHLTDWKEKTQACYNYNALPLLVNFQEPKREETKQKKPKTSFPTRTTTEIKVELPERLNGYANGYFISTTTSATLFLLTSARTGHAPTTCTFPYKSPETPHNLSSLTRRSKAVLSEQEKCIRRMTASKSFIFCIFQMADYAPHTKALLQFQLQK